MRRLVPEVIQTSSMDCGVAALKAALAGFGIEVDLGRLREACQTSVDGTSIDVLEDVCEMLGLSCEQRVMPVDFLLHPLSRSLPGMVVTRSGLGLTHFELLWSRHGDFLQMMDPGTGRRLERISSLRPRLHVHGMHVPAADWLAWFGDTDSQQVLAAIHRNLNVRPDFREEILATGRWQDLAALDAATRQVGQLVEAGALKPGLETGRLTELFAREAMAAERPMELLPEAVWSARPPDRSLPGFSEEEVEQVRIVGAVTLCFLGRVKEVVPRETLPVELQAALSAPPARPGRILWSLLASPQDSPEDDLTRLPLWPGWAAMVPLGAMLGVGFAAAFGAVVEALLFRSFLEVGNLLGGPLARLEAGLGIAFFLAILLIAELSGTAGSLWLGRRLETRLRLAFLSRIPRLGDRYFHSRTITDLASRSHSLYTLRQVPAFARSLVQISGGMLAASLGLLILDPWCFPVLLALLLLSALPMLLVQPAMEERDLRMRTQLASLMSFYLDALRGVIPIRAHGAEGTIRQAQESLLSEWQRSARGLLAFSVGAEFFSSLAALSGVVLLVGLHLWREGAGGEALLILWWALRIPMLTQALVMQARTYPGLRNVVLRLLEPLGTPVEGELPPEQLEQANSVPVGLSLKGVVAVAGGHPVLNGIDLEVAPGEHVAIVGRSGAGKSSLIGLFLGWLRPQEGELSVDGQPLTGAALYPLRQRIAWVDPEVRLWSRSLIGNLRYGSDGDGLATVLEAAQLLPVLERLPEGLQTELGEGGCRLSGGEGQRLRLGRAMLRSGTGLALLDEPFRGLDRPNRQRLMEASRRLWAGSTLLCVTHDMQETLGFPRVLVIEDGVVKEDGNPAQLMQEASRYRELVEAEAELQRVVWGDPRWRRLSLKAGVFEEGQ